MKNVKNKLFYVFVCLLDKKELPLKNKFKTMEEIKEMYEKIMDKKSFRENLSKVLFLNVRTVENSLLCRGKFKDKHLEKVKQCLTIQLQIDEKVKDMNIKAWKLI